MTTHRLTTEPHRAIVEFIDAGRPFALAVVLRAGSTPRKAGTKAIVDADGAIWGTIGGGLLESEARQAAVTAIQSRRPVVFDFKFAGTSACAPDPVCGGTMRILIDPTAGENRAAYATAVDSLRRRERGVLVTSLNAGADRSIVHWLPRCELASAEVADLTGGASDPEAARPAHAFAEGQYFCRSGQGTFPAVEGLAEPLIPTPLLIISGGGHVGQALAEQALPVGFDVVVIEDRPQFIDSCRFPAGVETRRGKLSELIAEFPIGRDTFIAIVGRGHLIDADALAACIDKPAAYIGMLGSRRKVALIRKDFLDCGKATAEQFDRIHAPIGLAIGAETVPEIAASIVAQLIAVRRGAL